ncbi:hypothetical protein [Streptomyces sp. NBC_01615]|uniref:hypothetical protein n=1 Tax=Streptomyces sp. NBC_01615 TaxID=2975898 RepID=UPI00386A5F0A
MKLTQETVNDLLARLGPADGYMYLPSDLDPQDLTDLLDRGTAPRAPSSSTASPIRRSTSPGARLSLSPSKTGP